MPWITIGPRNEYEMYVDDEDVELVSQRGWYVRLRYSSGGGIDGIVSSTKRTSG